MKIIRAKHLGMCFGVRDAIALAQNQATLQPLTILGDLVHNHTVMDELRASGVSVAHQLEQVTTAQLMITAHGASQKAIQQARTRGFQVTEATCPLVRFAHRTIQKLAQEGFFPVIVGQPNHVEVRGLTGDLDEFAVILAPPDLDQLPVRSRYGVASQTTQPVERVRELVSLMKHQFPHAEIRWVDTVCRPTKQRQQAAEELARAADIVLVIGGAHSNNTRELVQMCRLYCSRVMHIQNAEDICPQWFTPWDTVGITAGTSTPDKVIEEVEMRLHLWADTQLQSTPAKTELVGHH